MRTLAVAAMASLPVLAGGPISRDDFFKMLKKKLKKETLAGELRSRGASFRLSSTEEIEALRLGADVSMLVAIKMYYRDPGAKPKSAKPEAKDPPRTPRT